MPQHSWKKQAARSVSAPTNSECGCSSNMLFVMTCNDSNELDVSVPVPPMRFTQLIELNILLYQRTNSFLIGDDDLLLRQVTRTTKQSCQSSWDACLKWKETHTHKCTNV